MDQYHNSKQIPKCGLTENQMVQMRIIPLRQLLLEFGIPPKTEREIMSFRRMIRSRMYAQRHRNRSNDTIRELMTQKEELEREKEDLKKEIESYKQF